MTSPKLALDILPGKNGKVYYLPLAPKSRDHEERLKIGVRLEITHIDQRHDTLTITNINFSFPGTDLGFRIMAREQQYIDPEGGVLARGGTATWANGRVVTEDGEDRYNQIYLDGPPPPQLRVHIHCEQTDEPFVETFDLIRWGDPTGEGALLLPFLFNDLDRDEYVAASAFHYFPGGSSGSQIFAHDIGIEARVNGVWSVARTAEAPTQNTDIRIFGRPVRAMADGEVFEVGDRWRDNPYKNVDKDHPRYGSNYVWIRYGDLEVKYSHLRAGSVIVSAGQEVSAGQKLAEAGNSGNTGGDPHLHMECRLTAGSSLCGFTFRNTWMLARDLVPATGGNGRRVRLEDQGICEEYAALRPFATSPGPIGPDISDIELETLVAEILAGVGEGGGGFVIVGGRIIKVPPRGIKWALLESLVELDAADELAAPAAAKRRQKIADALDKAAKNLRSGS